MTANANLRRAAYLDETHARVRYDDRGKWDATVCRENLRLDTGLLAFADGDGEKLLVPTNWAAGQLCARLGIPVAYFRKCPEELQEAQANYWLKHGPHKVNETWLLRAKGAQLRAVLSDSYSPLDNARLLDELRALLPPHYRVDWFGLSEESLHLRVIDPNRLRPLLPDDPLTVGIHVANSEIGCRAVTVDALVYRLLCTNGLIRRVKGKSLLRQRHIHVSQTRFAGLLGEAVEAALQEAEGFREQLRRAAETPVADMEGVMEKAAHRLGLGDETLQAMHRSLRVEAPAQQETLYGLVNAVTAAAQRLPDEQRYDLEVLAGNLAQFGTAAFAFGPTKERRSDSHDLVAGNGHGLDVAPAGAGSETEVAPETDVVSLAQEIFEATVMNVSALQATNGRHS